MHDRIDDALLQYRLLKQKIDQVPDQDLTKRAVGWLAEAVCPIVDELVDNEEFRQQAMWPLLNLVNGAESETRTVLCELESKVVELAQLLVDVEWDTSDPPLPPITVNWSANPNASQLSLDELHRA